MIAKHTFAICAFQESPYLQACIDSLFNQTVRSEIIICTSTPDHYLSKISTKNSLQLKINPSKEGIASDWNFALRQAKTKYVTLAHQDDVYFPNFSHEMLATLDKNPGSLIAHSNYQELVHSQNQIFLRKYSLNLIIKYILNSMNVYSFGSPVGCPTVTYNMSNLKNFSFSNKFSINMDWYAWYQMSKMSGSIHWINKTLMSHRIHKESETSRGLAGNLRQSEDLVMFKKYWNPNLAVILRKMYSLSYGNNQ